MSIASVMADGIMAVCTCPNSSNCTHFVGTVLCISIILQQSCKKKKKTQNLVYQGCHLKCQSHKEKEGSGYHKGWAVDIFTA